MLIWSLSYTASCVSLVFSSAKRILEIVLRMRNNLDLSGYVKLILSLAAVASPITVVWALSVYLDMPVSESATTVGSIGTVIVVAFGATFAVYQFRLFRHNEPHLSVTQSVTHRSVSDSYVAIVVKTELRNSSRVSVSIRDALFRLQQLSRFSDAEVEALYARTFIHRDHNAVQWPTVEEIRRRWNDGEIEVEPGEAHSETYEFVVDKEFNSFLIYSIYYNPRSSNKQSHRKGWQATTVYSICNEV